jgi:hypothetical protein
LQISKELVQTDKNIALGIIYFPPSNSNVIGNDDYFHILESHLTDLSGEYNVMLVGDFNARTKDLDDSPVEITGSNGDMFDICTQTPLDLPIRVSKDMKPANKYGNELINFL